MRALSGRLLLCSGLLWPALLGMQVSHNISTPFHLIYALVHIGPRLGADAVISGSIRLRLMDIVCSLSP